MQIITDRGADLAPSQMQGLNIHFVPLLITLQGKTYRSNVDITSDEFYRMLGETDQFPSTAQPSIGDIAELMRTLAKDDPDILVFSISSGLSGTSNAFRLAADQVPEANITFFDTLCLSGEQGWQVEAAARAINAGWTLDQIKTLVEKVRVASDAHFTLGSLRYLVHGGRVSHMKGMLASILNIRPIIGVNKETGKYEQLAQARTAKASYAKMADLVADQHGTGTKLRTQIFHAANPEGVEQLKAAMNARFECNWGETAPVAPVLGAHTGPSMVALFYGPQAVYDEIPK